MPCPGQGIVVYSRRNALGNLGLIYRNQGDTACARDYWTRALAIFEAIEDPNAELVRGLLADLG